MRSVLFSFIFGSIFITALFSELYFPLSIALLAALLILILYKIGRGIVLLEMAALFYVFTCLIMPMVGYKYYSYDNSLSRLWIKYMPIAQNIYFPFVLPAVAGFCFAVTLPSFKNQTPDSGLQIQEKLIIIKEKLNGSNNKGLQIMIAGVLVSLVAIFLPAGLNYFAILIFFGSFAGLLYIYFTKSFRYKKIIMLLFILFVLGNALQSGMFTVVAYMGITIFSFFQVGKRTGMVKKFLIMLLGMFFLIVLQNVKGTYRKSTWKGSYEGNKAQLFSTLFSNDLQKGTSLLSQDALFPIYGRTNQGFNIAVVMRRIPHIQNYDNGERLLTVLASALVPRFLWADKPEAGGKFNMQYYAGVHISGWSTNVGTLGEAYGSFGVIGGIIYMCLLGLFLRWVYLKVFILSNKIPLLICWLPVLFYDTTSSAETDTLQVVNSIIKSAFFIWLLLKFLPQWFGINKNINIKKRRQLHYPQPV